MENNEIMINEDYDVINDVIAEEEGSGMSTGMAMLMGAGLTLAVGGAVKLGKWAYAKLKAKKEFRKPENEVIVEPEDLEAVVAE